MNETIKKILSVTLFGVIVYLAIIIAISTGVILIILAILCLSVVGAYSLWEMIKSKELMKKEENFDSLKDKEK